MPYRITNYSDDQRMHFGEWNITQHKKDIKANKQILDQTTIDKAIELWDKFKQKKKEEEQILSKLKPAIDEVNQLKEICKMYVSHFFQVLYLWQLRSPELNEEIFEYYSKDLAGDSLPSLESEEEILQWGQHLLEGEEKRIQAGGSAMVNPSAEEFKQIFDNYTTKLENLKIQRKATAPIEEELQQLRSLLDEIFEEIIAELEIAFCEEAPVNLRKKMRTYGVCYAYRPDEKPESEEDILEEAPPEAEDILDISSLPEEEEFLKAEILDKS